MTKIDIISGFLGAGKTTFIKKLLSEALKGEQVVLIENEFGEIGIDGGFLKDSGIEIREMNSGCICCSLVGDFGASLKEVISKYSPERIIIEPSGVGKLSDVIKAVEGVIDECDVVLNSTVTVVDGSKCKMYMKNFGEFFNNQVASAGTIIMSRTDKMSDEKIGEVTAMLRTLNNTASIVTTPIDKLTGSKVLELMENGSHLEEELLHEVLESLEEEEEHEHHHHEHDHHHHEEGKECCCGHEHEHEHHHHEEGEECCCGHDHEHEHHHHEEGEECSCGHHHHHHHADEVFTSWGRETSRSYEKSELQAILDKLANTEEYGVILRSKGMIKQADSDRWFYFDLVPGEIEIREGEPEFTGKLCVIGSKLDEEKLAELFRLV